MDYSLAKKLKDAGFSQVGGGRTSAEIIGMKRVETYYPTLEELIEACGKEFWNLTKRNEGGQFPWLAAATDPIVASGPTPTEAVAHLWLELNKQ